MTKVETVIATYPGTRKEQTTRFALDYQEDKEANNLPSNWTLEDHAEAKKVIGTVGRQTLINAKRDIMALKTSQFTTPAQEALWTKWLIKHAEYEKLPKLVQEAMFYLSPYRDEFTKDFLKSNPSITKIYKDTLKKHNKIKNIK